MKPFFIISVVFYFIWIVLKIHKKITNQRQVQNVIVAKPLIIKKNSWLHTDNEFGKMEKGVVYNETTNVNDSVLIDKDNPDDLDYEII